VNRLATLNDDDPPLHPPAVCMATTLPLLSRMRGAPELPGMVSTLCRIAPDTDPVTLPICVC
jgi:hypothetical protein